MRTVYLGTSDFAATVLDRLAGSAHRPALVVSRPDRPRGRGRRTQPPPVASRARELDIALLQPEDVNAEAAVEAIARPRPRPLLVCAYGADHPRAAAVGARRLQRAPVAAAALARRRTGRAGDRGRRRPDRRLASCGRPPSSTPGPSTCSATEPIEPDDDYGTLAPRLADLGGRLLVQALDQRPEPEPQPEEGVTYAEKIERDERRLDPEPHRDGAGAHACAR